MPSAGDVGDMSQPVKYSASGSHNDSPDTPFGPVKGLQEAHGLLLFIPGAGGVDQNITFTYPMLIYTLYRI